MIMGFGWEDWWEKKMVLTYKLYHACFIRNYKCFYYMCGLDEINFRASVQVHFYSVLHVL